MNKINEFKARKMQIENNIDLSLEGRKKALAALEREADNYRAASVRDLAIQWGALKQRMKRNIEDIQAQEATAAARWDYGRLNYMTQAVKAQVNSAASFDEVQSMYEKAIQNGDTHARRVWCEVVRENIAAKYKGGDAAVFVKKLQADLNGVLTTPELDALKAEGTELTKQAAELHAQTVKASEYFYDTGKRAAFGVQTEFDNLMQGVKISQKVDAETLTTVTSVELVG